VPVHHCLIGTKSEASNTLFELPRPHVAEDDVAALYDCRIAFRSIYTGIVRGKRAQRLIGPW
jgi:hypothetical protein